MSGHKSTVSLQKQLISAYPNIISELDIHTGLYLSSKVSSYQNEMLVLGLLLSVLQQKGQVAIRVSELLDKSLGEHLDAIASNLADFEDRNYGSDYFLGSGKTTEIEDSSKKTNKLGILDTKLTKNVLDGFVKFGIIGDVNFANYKTIVIQFPLVRQGDWIYLSRYWEAERTIVSGIKHRINGFGPAEALQKTKDDEVADPANDEINLNPDRAELINVISNSPSTTPSPEIHQRIHQYLFDTDGRTKSQIIAVKTALRNRFTIITGGPGTGKTRCITTLLAVLLEFDSTQKVALAAPTGKAAARMMESISQNLEDLNIQHSILQNFPKNASTLHRLIGWNPGTGKALFSKDRRLELDLLIIDEASMVDLAMLARVFKALPDTCRIILLGDKDQLSSVEAGAVFGEITRTLSNLQADITNSKSEHLVKSAEIHNPNDTNYDFMVNLSHSWRFSDESKLSDLAKLINEGNGDESWKLMNTDDALGVLNPKQINLINAVLPRINNVHNQIIHQIEKFTICEADLGSSEVTTQNVVSTEKFTKREHTNDDKVDVAEESAQQMAELFRMLKKSQILSAHRRGFGGSVMLNTIIDKELSARVRKIGDDSLFSEDGVWYVGRPVIVTQNDYNLGLFNGDVGITIKLKGQLVVSFGVDPKTNRIKLVTPSQLYNIESAWVITVHKSQGSEFENVLLVLPDVMSPVLTRELIYTAVTRSRNRVEVYGHEPVWNEAIQQKSGRYSGIGEMLTQVIS